MAEFDTYFTRFINTEPTTRIISLEEVARHDLSTDCWVVIYDRVYDITIFLKEHPGGIDLLLDYAGRDASLAFRSSAHRKHATNNLKDFYVGDLPNQEKIFRKPGGFILSDIPK